MNHELLETEISILTALNGKNTWDKIGDGADTNTNWTKAINEILYDLAKTEGRDYQVACKGPKRDNQEWLYDLVWYSENKHGIHEVQLIVESEWQMPERFHNEDYDYFQNIKYDFEKLLLGRSQTRLMIFEGLNQNEIDQHIKQLIEIIIYSNLTHVNDRYIFSVWNTETQEFYNQFYLHR
jgi:hypothetical protein